MAETHYEKFVDHIMSDDNSELGKVKAERDYALHCLEREIAICAETTEALRTALSQWKMYADMEEREGCETLADEKTAEGDLFRHCQAVLALVGGVNGD